MVRSARTAKKRNCSIWNPLTRLEWGILKWNLLFLRPCATSVVLEVTAWAWPYFIILFPIHLIFRLATGCFGLEFHCISLPFYVFRPTWFLYIQVPWSSTSSKWEPLLSFHPEGKLVGSSPMSSFKILLCVNFDVNVLASLVLFYEFAKVPWCASHFWTG